MFKNKFINFFLLLIFISSLAVAVKTVLYRINYEKTNKYFYTAISLGQIKKIATQGVVKQNLLFSKLKSIGINAIALEEDNIEDLAYQGKLSYFLGSEIINGLRVGHFNIFKKYQKQVKPEYVYLIIPDKTLFKRVLIFLKTDLGTKNVIVLNNNLIGVADDLIDLKSIGLGFDINSANFLHQVGFEVLLRPTNSLRINQNIINLKFEYFKLMPYAKILIFKGDTALGYPQKFKLVSKRIKKDNFKIGYVEFFDQLGIKNLIRNTPSNIIRVHSIPEEEMKNMSLEKAVQRYQRAVRERNMRIILLYPFLSNPKGENILDYNLKYFELVVNKITKSHGLSSKNDKINNYHNIRIRGIFILSLGLLIVFLYFSNFFLKLNYVTAGIISLLYISTFFILLIFSKLILWQQLSALLAGIIFPVLSLIITFPKDNNKRNGLFFLVQVFLVLLIGILFIVSFLSNALFINGALIFLGIKITFVLPLILLMYYFYFSSQDLSFIYYKTKKVLFSAVKNYYLIIILFLMAFIAIYLIRSGNFFAGKVPSVEQESRHLLEQIFGYRPRTKEFLIGWPILFLTFYFREFLSKKGWLWLGIILGGVAVTSVINTFSHVYTPFNVSLYRVILGLVLGYFIGLFFLILLKLLFFIISYGKIIVAQAKK